LIGTIASAPLLLVAPPNSPAGNVKELIALAKSRPGDLSYASPGTGSANHLAGESLKTMSAIDVVHVPYKGAAPAETDVMGGAWRSCSTPSRAHCPRCAAAR